MLSLITESPLIIHISGNCRNAKLHHQLRPPMIDRMDPITGTMSYMVQAEKSSLEDPTHCVHSCRGRTSNALPLVSALVLPPKYINVAEHDLVM